MTLEAVVRGRVQPRPVPLRRLAWRRRAASRAPTASTPPRTAAWPSTSSTARHFYVTAAIGPAEIWNGAWHHVAGVFDGQLAAAARRRPSRRRPDRGAADHRLCLDVVRPLHRDLPGQLRAAAAGRRRPDPAVARAAGARLHRRAGRRALTAPAASPPHGRRRSPETVPVATEADSRADAPASRPTLAPIAPGTLVRGAQPARRRRGAQGRRGRPGARLRRALGQQARASRSPDRPDGARRAARQAAEGHARHRDAGRLRPQAPDARPRQDGRATAGPRLRLRPVHRTTIQLAVPSRTDCSGVKLTVLRARSR